MHILSLRLYTAKLKEIEQFYSQTLGLSQVRKSENEVIFTIGDSELIFEYRAESEPYHFAFNIPSNQIHEAHAWLKDRVELLKDGQAEIIDFPRWGAEALYFHDPDQNIVEFIAREPLNQATNTPFSARSLLHVSEIGMPVHDIEPIQQQLHSEAGLSIYDGTTERFCAVGSPRGLFILLNYHRKVWYPTNANAHPADFRMLFETPRGLQRAVFENEILTIRS